MTVPLLPPLRLGTRSFDGFAVMAVVNRTPDSFFDRGATYGFNAAMAAVDRAVAEGADIVDIGGVKAGPGDEVDVTEELRRVVDLVTAVRDRHPALVISVDGHGRIASPMATWSPTSSRT
jgi:dihydropteroate synthase